jgi:hypothetical protein
MQCPKGHANPTDYRHCGQCGVALGASSTWHGSPPPEQPLPFGAPPVPSWGYAPTVPSRSTGRGWSSWSTGAQIATVAATLVIIGFVMIVALTLVKIVGDNHSTTVPDQVSASSADDWERAICQPGTFVDGAGNLHNADTQARCVAKNQRVPLAMGEYSTSFTLENDVAPYRGNSYATITLGNGRTWVAIAMVPGAGPTAVEPLTKFGFELHAVPRG